MSPTRTAIAAVVVTFALVGGACASDDRAQSSELTVSAASSLADVFSELGDQFVREHPGISVRLNVGSSAQLSAQVRAGADADVVAFADGTSMQPLAEQRLLDGPPADFASNSLAIVAKPSNPLGIDELEDLAAVGVVSLCAGSAPCGRYTAEVLRAAEVVIPRGSVTEGQDARSTLGAVAEGDAVAGIVYATDASGAGDDVAIVPIPPVDNVRAVYQVAVVRGAAPPEAARAFASFVAGPTGRAILGRSGFGDP